MVRDSCSAIKCAVIAHHLTTERSQDGIGSSTVLQVSENKWEWKLEVNEPNVNQACALSIVEEGESQVESELIHPTKPYIHDP